VVPVESVAGFLPGESSRSCVAWCGEQMVRSVYRYGILFGRLDPTDPTEYLPGKGNASGPNPRWLQVST